MQVRNEVLIKQFKEAIEKMLSSESKTDSEEKSPRASVAMVEKAIRALDMFSKASDTGTDRFEALMKMSSDILEMTDQSPYPKISDMLSLQFVTKFHDFLRQINVDEYFTSFMGMAAAALYRPHEKMREYLANLKTYHYFFQLVIGSSILRQKFDEYGRELAKRIADNFKKDTTWDADTLNQFIKDELEIIDALKLPFQCFGSGTSQAFLMGDYDALTVLPVRSSCYNALIDRLGIIKADDKQVVRKIIREHLKYDVEKCTEKMTVLKAQFDLDKEKMLSELDAYTKEKHDSGKKNIMAALLNDIKKILNRGDSLDRKIKSILQALLIRYKEHNTHIVQKKITAAESGRLFDRYLAQLSHLFFMVDEFSSSQALSVLGYDEREIEGMKPYLSPKTDSSIPDPSSSAKKGLFGGKGAAVSRVEKQEAEEFTQFKLFLPEVFSGQLAVAKKVDQTLKVA